MSNTNEDRKLIASRLRSAREMAGLSQAQVAKLLELHRPSVSEMEAGRRGVSAGELAKLSEIYSIDLDLLAGSESKSDEGNERIRFAARQLAKLKEDDLDKVIKLLSALRPKKGKE